MVFKIEFVNLIKINTNAFVPFTYKGVFYIMIFIFFFVYTVIDVLFEQNYIPFIFKIVISILTFIQISFDFIYYLRCPETLPYFFVQSFFKFFKNDIVQEYSFKKETHRYKMKYTYGNVKEPFYLKYLTSCSSSGDIKEEVLKDQLLVLDYDVDIGGKGLIMKEFKPICLIEIDNDISEHKKYDSTLNEIIYGNYTVYPECCYIIYKNKKIRISKDERDFNVEQYLFVDELNENDIKYYFLTIIYDFPFILIYVSDYALETKAFKDIYIKIRGNHVSSFFRKPLAHKLTLNDIISFTANVNESKNIKIDKFNIEGIRRGQSIQDIDVIGLPYVDNDLLLSNESRRFFRAQAMIDEINGIYTVLYKDLNLSLNTLQ